MTEEQLPGSKWDHLLAKSRVDVDVIDATIEKLKANLARAEAERLELIALKEKVEKA
jgi:hypothetical protein